MRYWKRLFAGALAGLILMTSCTSHKETISNQDHLSGVTTITWWSFPVFSQEEAEDADGTYETKLIEAFEAQHPDIKVELKLIDFNNGPQKLSSAIVNKNVCDVILDAPGRIVDYGKNGYMVNLNELFSQGYCEDVDNNQLLESCKNGTDAYMYPLSSAPFYMAFNKKMLEDAGVINLVREGWTTEDFVEVVTALRKHGYIAGSFFYNGTGGDQGTRAFVSNLYSSSITDSMCSSYTINDEAGIKGLKFVKDAVADGLLINGNFMNGTMDIENFVSGQTSFTLLWGASQQQSNQKVMELNQIETVEVPYPSEDGVAELEYLVNGFGIFNNGDEAKIAASKEFIRFACDDAVWGKRDVIQTGCIPVRHSFGELYYDDHMKEISSWTQYYSTYYNTVDGYADMRENWCQMIKNIIYDDKTVEKAVDDFVEQSEKGLKSREDKS